MAIYGTELPSGAQQDLADMAETLGRITLRAGATVLRAYDAHVPIRLKPDLSPVCEADEASEEIILAELQRAYPLIPVVSEEAVSQGRIPSIGDEFFLVDPLDGTREFAARNGEFTTNIALIRDGQPVCGAVFAPVTGRLWLGAAGQAWEISVAAQDSSIDWARRKRVRTQSCGERPLVALLSRSHLDEGAKRFLLRLPIGERRQIGSSVKFCLIASGEGNVYPRFGPTMEWDTAAGDAVLRAAGGIVVEATGAPLRYGKAGDGFHNRDFIAWGDPESALAAAR